MPGELLGRLSLARRGADDAEAEVLEIAVEWAHSHPVTEGQEGWDAAKSWRVGPSAIWQPGELDATVANAPDDETVEWCGIPPVAWDAPAAFAAANSMSTTAGKALIRDALVLRHRLPRVWARVVEREVPAWRARKIAQAVLGAHADVVEAVDAAVVAIAHKVGPVTLARILDEQLLRLHAEEREIKQLEDLDARYVHFDEASINDTGIADLAARGDFKDLHDLDQTLTAIAAALKQQGCTESLDVRRSLALGILADPAQAQAMLTGAQAPAPARKKIVLHLHLSHDAVEGREPIGGTTCICNLAPLCRHHHRLKTHTTWTYRPLDPLAEPGVYLWTDPHGLTYLREPTGTTALPPPSPPPAAAATSRAPDTDAA